MKKILFIITILISLTGCKSEYKEIPYDTIEDMIADIVLMESYVKNVTKPNSKEKDTIDYYTPILKKYGYTINDFESNIEKMSRRKTDIVWNTLNNSVNKLSTLQKKYEKNNQYRLAWIRSVTKRTTDTLFHYNDTIFVSNPNMVDTLFRSFPLRNKGTYTFSYQYEIDHDAEKNNTRYFVYFLEDTLNNKEPKRSSFWVSKTRGNESRITKRNIIVKDLRKYNKLDVYPFSYTNKHKSSFKQKINDTTSVKIYDFMVTYKPNIEDVENDIILEDYNVSMMLDIRRSYDDNILDNIITPLLPYENYYDNNTTKEEE